MSAYTAIKYLHLTTVWITITLFIIRFYWRWRESPLLARRWVRIAPHVNDTLLLAFGIALIFLSGISPFSPDGRWLLDKIVLVIIYILLGSIALGKHTRREKIRWLAFICGLACLYTIYRLASSKLPLLTGFL
ncbi:SirB2 family protein [Sodalis sp. RH21]|uniref:SirB2 family protein n=1 Tax=unclassified Sodalis (in: enterobacteria) TaxID=2636512 RepID=UPI0039B63658